MKNLYWTLFLILFLISCSEETKREVQAYPIEFKDNELDSLNRPLYENKMGDYHILKSNYIPYLNPKEKFIQGTEAIMGYDSMNVHLISKILYDATEPVLSYRFLGKESYRLLIFPGTVKPIIIRFEKIGDGFNKIIKLLHYNEDTHVYQIEHEFKSIASLSDWNEFQKNLNNNHFWDTIDIILGRGNVIDGTAIIFEAHCSDGYKIIKRYYPIDKKEDCFDPIYRYILSVSKVTFENRNWVINSS